MSVTIHTSGDALPMTFYSEKQLCQTILKSMHKFRSSDMDKLNLRSIDYFTLKCDLNLQPTCINVSNGTFNQ